MSLTVSPSNRERLGLILRQAQDERIKDSIAARGVGCDSAGNVPQARNDQMKTVTIIINSPPYGSESPYNALRLALTLTVAAKVRLFLLGDGVLCAKKG